MKNYLQLLIILIFASTASAEYQITPEDISRAEQIREMGLKLGLNKPVGEETISALALSAGGKTELTPEARAVMTCIYRKAQDIQYKSNIKFYARYLADEEFEKKTTEAIEDECGLTKLADEQK